MPKRYNRCYMTSWIIAFMSQRQSRELPTHSYILLKITLKKLPYGGGDIIGPTLFESTFQQTDLSTDIMVSFRYTVVNKES